LRSAAGAEGPGYEFPGILKMEDMDT
jgi:hypothetical protein